MNHDEYVKLAAVEDHMWYFRSLHRHVLRELDRALRRDQPARVLDAGCGTGGLIVRLQPRRPSWKWSAFDFSPVAVEFARERCGTNVDIRQASVTALPYADDSFDVACAMDVLSQIEREDVRVALRELHRVVRRGGTVIMSGPAYPWMRSYHDESTQTKHRFRRREVQTLLADAGFVEASVTHWNALLFPVIFARRKLFASTADTSDVKTYPAPVEVVCNGVMALEHAWLEAGGRWAWGNSVIATARKR